MSEPSPNSAQAVYNKGYRDGKADGYDLARYVFSTDNIYAFLYGMGAGGVIAIFLMALAFYGL